MFEVDKFLYKPSFGDLHPCDPCHPHHEPEHHCPPRYTMTEEVEHTARLMRETIDRLLKFEERAKAEIAKLSKQVMSDNVIFKNTMYEAYNGFLMEVKNEINIFEGNIEADIKLFKQEIETNYANLAETVNTRIVEFESKYEKEMTELNTSIQNQYNAFIEAVNERIDLNNENMSQAFAEYQRQLTTEMNTFQQNMTANYESFTESIGNSFHEFRQNWEETMTQRFAAQDGKISDAEAYMKTNLGATVTTLIGDMHANGDFTEIIEGEVFNDLEMRSKLEYHEANEEIGLATCAAYCRANKRIFYVPYGKTVNVEETLDLTGMDVEINGTLNIKHNGVGIIVGDSSNLVNHRKIYINTVTHTAYKTGDISIRVQGLKNGNVTIGNAPYIQLFADGDTSYDSIAYSKFDIGCCNYLQITDKLGASKQGWINENTFFGCRVRNQLMIHGFTYKHNNNVFYKPCLEGATILLSNCSRNKFYDVRNEGETIITMDKNTENNFIRMNYMYDNFEFLGDSVTDYGMNNIVTNSALETYAKTLVYNANHKTFTKDVYSIVDKDDMSAVATEDGFRCAINVPAWAKFIEAEKIPVDGVVALHVSCIGMDDDLKELDDSCMRVTVKPYDENGNLLSNDPLAYIGGGDQKTDGSYGTSGNIKDVLIVVRDSAVKFIELDVKNGNGAYNYKNLSIYAYHKPDEHIAGALLADWFKN